MNSKQANLQQQAVGDNLQYASDAHGVEEAVSVHVHPNQVPHTRYDEAGEPEHQSQDGDYCASHLESAKVTGLG